MKFALVFLCFVAASVSASSAPSSYNNKNYQTAGFPYQAYFNGNGDFVFQNNYGRRLTFSSANLPEAQTAAYEIYVEAADLPDGKIVLNNLANYFPASEGNYQRYESSQFWAEQYQTLYAIFRQYEGPLSEAQYQQFEKQVAKAVKNGELEQVFYDVFQFFSQSQSNFAEWPQYLVAAYQKSSFAAYPASAQNYGPYSKYFAYRSNSYPSGYYGFQFNKANKAGYQAGAFAKFWAKFGADKPQFYKSYYRSYGYPYGQYNAAYNYPASTYQNSYDNEYSSAYASPAASPFSNSYDNQYSSYPSSQYAAASAAGQPSYFAFVLRQLAGRQNSPDSAYYSYGYPSGQQYQYSGPYAYNYGSYPYGQNSYYGPYAASSAEGYNNYASYPYGQYAAGQNYYPYGSSASAQYKYGYQAYPYGQNYAAGYGQNYAAGYGSDYAAAYNQPQLAAY